ncbi:MAG: penicillin-binding protein 2 [Candidatus Omnitrophica bacterium]|nr:penicillin-binding protein 2 [Candidatus Omnitrophota bacterium]
MDIKLIRNLSLGGLIILVISLFYYQVIKGDMYLNRAQANYIRVVSKEAIRGTILDRNYETLAYDRGAFNIAVIPYQIKDNKEELFSKISRLAKVKKETLTINYNRNFRSPFYPVDILIDIDKEKALALKEELGEEVIIEEIPQRHYPFGKELAHILGYVKRGVNVSNNSDVYGYIPYQRVGLAGIEKYYNNYLAGRDGGELLEVDALGKIAGFLGANHPKKGKDIVLTIDLRLQRIAYQLLSEYKRGVIIVMDPRDGQIHVFCSQPSYEPNQIMRGVDFDSILKAEDNILLNRGIQARYPLGSVFKPILSIAGLEEKKITSNTTFICEGRYRLGNLSFECRSAHGKQNLIEALAHSCNVYFYNVGAILDIDKIAKWAKKFGLNTLTGIDLPYEKSGIVPDQHWKITNIKSPWFKGDTLNVSIGQGYLEATPLEVLVAISAFANGGYLVKPHLVKEIEGENISLSPSKFLDLSLSHINEVKKGLEAVVSWSNGTAHLLDTLKLSIAGKTGTAQTIGKSHGWFVGFFPSSSPKYSICVFLENVGSSSEAVKVAYDFLKEAKNKGIISQEEIKR